MTGSRISLVGSLVGALLALVACDQRMIKQEKDVTWGETPLFADRKVVQAPVPGTIARGELEWYRTLANRPPMTHALLERGRERYGIFCVPCHGAAGYGDGIIVEHGMPAPPSYHIPRLRQATDAHFMTVIAEGYGAMYPYGSRVPPVDRWAIVGYIRALQLSQHAELAGLPPAMRTPFAPESSSPVQGQERDERTEP